MWKKAFVLTSQIQQEIKSNKIFLPITASQRNEKHVEVHHVCLRRFFLKLVNVFILNLKKNIIVNRLLYSNKCK